MKRKPKMLLPPGWVAVTEPCEPDEPCMGTGMTFAQLWSLRAREMQAAGIEAECMGVGDGKVALVRKGKA